MRSASLLLAAFLPISPLAAGDAAPAGRPEPVDELTPFRAEIVLDGEWGFAPASAVAPPDDAASWGRIRVPGSWTPGGFMPGVTAKGGSKLWENLDLAKLGGAWLRRTACAPASWSGRELLLSFERVSTDAIVRIDGKEAGRIAWPGGELDVSEAVEAGKPFTLDVFVAAVPDKKKALHYLTSDVCFEADNALRLRGVIGDVVLSSRPKGARIDGLFIRTSVKESKIFVDAELAGVERPGEAVFEISAREAPSGKLAWSERLSANLAAAPFQTLKFEIAWKNPKLWEPDSPNLYNLTVASEGASLRDAVRERFGFRELRIEGKGFVLNGIPWRIRPTNDSFQAFVAGLPQGVRNALLGCKRANFNAMEIFPSDIEARGSLNMRPLYAKIADETGMPLIYPFTNTGRFFDSWRSGGKEAWRKEMTEEWRRIRNHPSIFMLVSDGIRYSFGDDLNPRRIGQSEKLVANAAWIERSEPAREAVGAVQALDPSRPVFLHDGGGIGALQGGNVYLNMLPLQEREEWLSEWAKHGDKPYMVTEMGTPFSFSFMRARSGFSARTSEPWFTEQTAAMLGEEAAFSESARYRDEIRAGFIGGWKYKDMLGSMTALNLPAHLKFQALFVKNTWRSWRLYGISGGMIPWEQAYGWTHGDAIFNVDPFVPGTRGVWRPRAAGYQLYGLAPGGFMLNVAGAALLEANAPLQAWIAGRPGAFVEKGRNFRSGELARKQIAVVNDSRAPQSYACSWKASCGGKSLGSGSFEGVVHPGENVLLPVEFKIRETETKADGEIELTANIGTACFSDKLQFRAFPPRVKRDEGELLALDLDGETTKALEAAWRVKPFSPERLAAAKTLVAGKGALASNALEPELLRNFVKNGGRLVILEQTPETLSNGAGLRIRKCVERRAFVVSSMREHPLATGLDADDLRDWRGAGSLVPAETGTELDGVKSWTPARWHWGNRGSVASAAIEKIQNGGWTPVLECGFDLAYSPLMELRYGKGLVVWSSLDLIGRSEADPAAEFVLDKIVARAFDFKPEPEKKPASFLGDDATFEELKRTGLIVRKEERVPGEPGLLIASGAKLPQDEMKSFVSKGGRVLFLGAEEPQFGFSSGLRKSMGGASKIPAWPECAGVSVFELRLKASGDFVVLKDGPEVAAGGLLGRFVEGKGSAVIFALPPWSLNAAEKTYYHFTEWRFRRALSQILSNMGAEFQLDSFAWPAGARPPASKIALAGGWRCKVETLLPPAKKPGELTEWPAPKPSLDPGWEKPGFDASSWSSAALPGELKEFKDFDGVMSLRRDVTVLPEMAGKDLLLRLGKIDDCDETSFNGERVGGVGLDVKDSWSKERVYLVPGRLVKPGLNTIAVRVFDSFGNGGLGCGASPEDLRLEIPGAIDFYAPGFVTEFEQGDEPCRYVHW